MQMYEVELELIETRKVVVHAPSPLVAMSMVAERIPADVDKRGGVKIAPEGARPETYVCTRCHVSSFKDQWGPGRVRCPACKKIERSAAEQQAIAGQCGLEGPWSDYADGKGCELQMGHDGQHVVSKTYIAVAPRCTAKSYAVPTVGAFNQHKVGEQTEVQCELEPGHEGMHRAMCGAVGWG